MSRPQTYAGSSALNVVTESFQLLPGNPQPLGSTVTRHGVNFAIVSRSATMATLVLFEPEILAPVIELPLNPGLHRTGDIWHAFLEGIDPGIEYGFRFDRRPNESEVIFPFDPNRIMLDPYARATSRHWKWGNRGDHRSLRCVVVEDDFDWELDKPLRIPLADTIIYELHVRGYTQHASSGAGQPGSFLGLVEKIPYLRELGVTAVELMPVCEFDEVDNQRTNPQTGEALLNFWGYHPLLFFAPMAAYSVCGRGRDAVNELKTAVKAFHAAGIEVILDVVFNHTGEGGQSAPPISFRGIDNPLYYMMRMDSGQYLDFSGCGNTINCSSSVVREMVLDVLKHWVSEYHIDGFRFDLASALGRGAGGEVLANPPLLERIVADPCLSDVKLIAEAWDAGGLYQVGNFPAYGRWAEWNGKFRDDLRRFVNGEPGMVPQLAARLAGSPDLYHGSSRRPFHSINFVTCHDGFTLRDLVSYEQKHNEANGENNRDGTNDHASWNCGTEGKTTDPNVLQLRQKQSRNIAALLLMAHGVPMILYGDEVGRSQLGNNNAYCQDNSLTWMNWNWGEEENQLLRYFRCLTAFRRKHPVLRRDHFENGSLSPRISMAWHGVKLFQPDWSPESRSLALHLRMDVDGVNHDEIFLIANAYWEHLQFELPDCTPWCWARFLDSSLDPPNEICRPGEEAALQKQQSYMVAPRSVVVLVGQEASLQPRMQ